LPEAFSFGLQKQNPAGKSGACNYRSRKEVLSMYLLSVLVVVVVFLLRRRRSRLKVDLDL
jgi:hypothetical protein